MAQVVETREPAVVREERVEHVHDDAGRGSNTGLILGIILLIIILIALFSWRPWAGSGGGSNINVTAPTPTSTH